MILVSKHLFRKNYVGLSLWPFIIVKYGSLKEDVFLINHERIHLKQQLELLVVPFYVLYLLEWIVKSIYYWDRYKGYQNLSFEREAYHNERNLDYLDRRPPFGFIKYLWM